MPDTIAQRFTLAFGGDYVGEFIRAYKPPNPKAPIVEASVS
jgi:hypothetical protein